MHLAAAELVPPFIVPELPTLWQDCPAEQVVALQAARAGAGSVGCLHWDGLDALESAGASAFVATTVLDVQQGPCPDRGCEEDGGIWQLETQKASVVAAAEDTVLKMAHSFRTHGSPAHAGDARQLSGRLVRYLRPEDSDSPPSVHRHDGRAYEVLQEWPAGSGLATRVPLRLLLRSAGVGTLDAPSDASRPTSASCAEARSRGSSAGCHLTGESMRGRGVALELHVTYSNLWLTSDSLWDPSRWLRPAASPSYQMHARRLPLREANRVSHTNLPNGSRVVRTRFGVKLHVLGSGVLGAITPGSVWTFVVETVIGLGMAWTATELVLSAAAQPRGSIGRRLADAVIGGAAQAEQVCAALYWRRWDGGALRRAGAARLGGERGRRSHAD